MRRPFLVLFCCCSTAAAQQVLLTAYPQETLQNGNGNASPFGCFASGAAAEARSQILLRALELPGPGAVLQGIEVHCWSNVSVTYSALVITAAPTTAAALSSTFAANVQSPQTVLQAAALPVAYTTSAWTPIPFSTPYVHDGVHSLVLDIQKVVDPSTLAFVTMDTSSSPPRTDRPLMVYAFGNPGSGAANSTTAFAAADPISVRLRWAGAPTMRHRSDLGASQNQYSLGGTVVHTVQGTPGSLYLSMIATSFLPTPAPLPPVVGLLRVNGVVFALGFLDAVGEAQLTVGIPANPGLVGTYLAYQSGTLDAVTGVPMFTNGADHFVNP